MKKDFKVLKSIIIWVVVALIVLATVLAVVFTLKDNGGDKNSKLPQPSSSTVTSSDDSSFIFEDSSADWSSVIANGGLPNIGNGSKLELPDDEF
ncbi:MAG: hypothetical protein J6S13_06035 [Clostridia bacterium]|nr:hypothetical protein [Clostridia bacterium]